MFAQKVDFLAKNAVVFKFVQRCCCNQDCHCICSDGSKQRMENIFAPKK